MAGNGKAAFFGGLSKPQREPSVFPPPYGRGEHEKLSETDTPWNIYQRERNAVMITNAFDPNSPAIIQLRPAEDRLKCDACIVTFSDVIEQYVLNR